MSKKPRRSEREMELEDRLADVLEGFGFWRDQKMGSLEWSTADEMFARWVEHGRHTETRR